MSNATICETDFKTADRVMTNFLAQLERRCLLWLAARMPARVNSDHLTALALAAMLMTGFSYWLASITPWGLVLATVWLAVNWFGDSLDGTLARVRNQQRPRYGFYVDHVLDAFGILFLVGGLGLSGYMSPVIGIALLVAYFMLCIEVYLATYCLSTFRISFWKLGPTELRLLLAAGNVVLLVHPATILGTPYRLFDVAGLVAIAGLAVTLVVSFTRNVRTLYRAEPLSH